VIVAIFAIAVVAVVAIVAIATTVVVPITIGAGPLFVIAVATVAILTGMREIWS